MLFGFFFDNEEEEESLAPPTPPPALMMNAEEVERQFHDAVREHIIFFLLFICLYLFSYWILSKFKQRNIYDSLFAGEEDYFVYRVTLWMCTVSAAVSIGSTVLMPFSVLGAELLQRYPDNYYLQWLSWSLIHSLWNYVFVLANLSLFVLLPFSYFFLESQGFSSKTKGILGRLYETLAVCALLIVVLLCLCDLIYNLLVASSTSVSFLSLFSIFSITSVNLPLIYSCVSFCGVALLLVSTPVGFSRMFTIVSEKAQARIHIPDDDEDRVIERFELFCQRGKAPAAVQQPPPLCNGLYRSSSVSSFTTLPYLRVSPTKNGWHENGSSKGYGSMYSLADQRSSESLSGPQSYGSYGGFVSEVIGPCGDFSSSSGSPIAQDSTTSTLHSSFSSLSAKLPLREKTIRWYQRLANAIKYPVCILALVLLTSIAVLMVVINTLKLFFGYRALPVYVQYMEVQSRHTFGIVGVFVEIIIILYVMATSLVGFYSMPIISSIRPRMNHTSMTAIIINCSSLVVLSSALPVLAVTLGITSFDLLGAFGSLRWLTNFRLVIAYNVAFAGVTIAILAKQLTSHFFRELAQRLFCRRGYGVADEKLPEKVE